MEYDKELLRFFRNGANDHLAINIFGSFRTHNELQYKHSKTSNHIRYLTKQDGGQQASDNMMMDRGSTTRDIMRWRRSHDKDIDLRYMKIIKSLQEKLKSAYMCNKRRCPAFRDRMQLHKMKHHSSNKSSGSSECKTPPSANIKSPSIMISTSPATQSMRSKSESNLKNKGSFETEYHVSQTTSPYNILISKPNQCRDLIDNTHESTNDSKNQYDSNDVQPGTSKNNSYYKYDCNFVGPSKTRDENLSYQSTTNVTNPQSDKIVDISNENNSRNKTDVGKNDNKRGVIIDEYNGNNNYHYENSKNKPTASVIIKTLSNSQCNKPTSSINSKNSCNSQCNEPVLIASDKITTLDTSFQCAKDNITRCHRKKSWDESGNSINVGKDKKIMHGYTNNNSNVNSDNLNDQSPLTKTINSYWNTQTDEQIDLATMTDIDGTSKHNYSSFFPCGENVFQDTSNMRNSYNNDVNLNTLDNRNCTTIDKVKKNVIINNKHSEDNSKDNPNTIQCEKSCCDAKCKKIADISEIAEINGTYGVQYDKSVEITTKIKRKSCDTSDNICAVDRCKITSGKDNNQCENSDVQPMTSNCFDSYCNVQYNNFVDETIYKNAQSEDNINSMTQNNIFTDGLSSRTDNFYNGKYNYSKIRLHKQNNSNSMKLCKHFDTQNRIRYIGDTENSRISPSISHSKHHATLNNKKSYNNDNLNNPTVVINECYNSCNSKTDDTTLLEFIENQAISRPRISTDGPIRLAVTEWIQGMPLFPGLGKETKENNDNIINNLIKNVCIILADSKTSDYKQKIKDELDSCLKYLPIWYPGAKRDQSNFIADMIERLFKKLNKVYNRKTGTTYTVENSKRISSKNTDICYGSLVNKNEIRNEVLQWLLSINLRINNVDGIRNNITEIADFIVVRINPLINSYVHNNIYKINLVTTIFNILNNLPIDINCPSRKTLRIHQYAQALANRLLCIRAKYLIRSKKTNTPRTFHCCTENCMVTLKDDYRQKAILCSAVRKCFENENIDCHNLVVEETSVIIVDFIKIPDPEREHYAKNEIINLLVTSTNLSEAQASSVAKMVLKKVKNMIADGTIITKCCHKFNKSMNVSVYTFMEDSAPLNYPTASTPKKKQVKKIISKLNPQEIEYMEKLSKVVSSWMDTLPKGAPKEQDFRQTIINNLVNDIVDYAKFEQLTNQNKNNRKDYLYYFVRRWIWRVNAFEIDEADTKMEELVNKIKSIPVPLMTKPQHGNRQAMSNLKYREEHSYFDSFLPKASDILEDQISIWMNEQPSYIFATNDDPNSRNKKIYELAQVLGNKLENKRPITEISKEVSKWLQTIVKTHNKKEIAELSENLKDRVIYLPQDATLAANLDMKLKLEATENESYIKPTENKPIQTSNTSKNETFEQEQTMKMFLSKYIEHNHDIDDPLARRAFNRLLKSHLQSVNPQTRQEIYNNLRKRECHESFPPQNLIEELEYIKDISDWLKNLPLEASYNTLNNRRRIDFVNNLAMNIREIEEERRHDPSAMNFDVYMASIIHVHLRELPILKEYVNRPNYDCMTIQLLDRIIAHRQIVLNKTKANESINTTGVNTDNIGDIIEEFIQNNGDDIAQDEIKLEAWAIRLIREVKKLVQSSSRPSILSKAYVYNKLSSVSKPGDETGDLFRLELEYVKEISNWLKNLPLLPIDEDQENERVRKICELAEKISEYEQDKTNNPNDKTISKLFEEYVAKWILDLPLDTNRDIVLPIVIKQLMKRIEKVKGGDDLSKLSFTQLNNITETSRARKNCSTCKYRNKSKNQKNGNDIMVDVIERWSNALPLNGNNKTIQDLKDDISKKLCQRVGQLNMDTRVFNDDLMYRDIIADDIDKILDNIPANDKIQTNREQLKNDIISSIIEAKNIIKENVAGDAYKIRLENTIEASIPHPVNVNYIFDPGFEIYKSRLATMFILDNFDNASDIVKMKYEKLLKKEIDRFFEHAKNKNTVPLSKEVIYSELYSALFKVPIPNEAAIIQEVEELKTRCEIDTWFEELPIKEADGLHELLEWDKILSTLAKRIHEIESAESNPDQKIVKEIMKWLVKLPFRPGNENKLEYFAEKLQKLLKSTAFQRKCVLNDSKSNKNKKGKNKQKQKKIEKGQREQQQVLQANVKSFGNTSPQKTSKRRTPRRKAADEIFNIVEAWCDQLPVGADTNNQKIKVNLTTKIIIKISELNMNPSVFNDDDWYDELLDAELEKLLSTVPISNNFGEIKTDWKNQLKAAIKSIKPLISEERLNHIYKETLNGTVNKIFDTVDNLPPEKVPFVKELKNNIIDDFLQYKYCGKDDDSRRIHKNNLHDNVSKLVDVMDNKGKEKINKLMKTNQLITELAKVPTTSKTNDRDEVEEIRMKNEVSEFFKGLHLEDKNVDISKVNHLKLSLTKKLNEIELLGHTPENENKMKREIERCLSKLDKQVNTGVIDAFIIKLKNSETLRRTHQMSSENDDNLSNRCEEACKRVCHPVKSDWGLGQSSIHYPSTSNFNIVPTAPLRLNNVNNSFNNPPSCIDCPFSSQVREITGEPLEQINDKEELSADYESGSEDDKEGALKCPCNKRKSKVCRCRPVCMVPMKWICEGCNSYSPFWCRMPLPGFF